MYSVSSITLEDTDHYARCQHQLLLLWEPPQPFDYLMGVFSPPVYKASEVNFQLTQLVMSSAFLSSTLACMHPNWQGSHSPRPKSWTGQVGMPH